MLAKDEVERQYPPFIQRALRMPARQGLAPFCLLKHLSEEQRAEELDALVRYYLRLYSDPLVTQYLVVKNDEDSIRRWLETLISDRNIFYTKILVGDSFPHIMIGHRGIRDIDLEQKTCEAGVVIQRNYWGYGIALETLRFLLEAAWPHILTVKVRVQSGNEKSLRAIGQGMLGQFRFTEEIVQNGIKKYIFQAPVPKRCDRWHPIEGSYTPPDYTYDSRYHPELQKLRQAFEAHVLGSSN